MLARDHQGLWYFQNTKEPLSGQPYTVAAFVQGAVSASPANLSPGCSSGREGSVKSRAAPTLLGFCLCPFCLSQREKEKQRDKGVGGLSLEALFTGAVQSWRDKHDNCGPAQPAATSLL